MIPHPHPGLADDLNVGRTPSGSDEVWDLLVVGGGTAGIVGARTAARFGARVLLVERGRTGGDCLWTGCVPSKSLLAAADAAATARGSAHLGVDVTDVEVDFAAVAAHVRGAVDTIAPVDSPASMESQGVVVWAGDLLFRGPGEAEVDGRVVQFTQALLATGAAPTVPPVDGLEAVDPLTSETVWQLDALPRRLAVLGGGTVGCELGQAFSRLGAQVTLVEGAGRLLPAEDPDAAAALRRALVAEGVDVRTGTLVTGVRPGATAGSGTLVTRAGDDVAFDRLVVAVGRTPRTAGLGLETLDVELDEHGHVVVDAHLRSTNPRVWAAGDLTGHPQLTHVAGVHGSLAASNAVLGLPRSVDPVVPRVTYTQPEVAAVGATTTDGAGRPPGARVLTWPHTHVDRAVAEGRTDGFTRIVVDRTGRVRGATVVGPHAGETLGELTVAVRQGLTTRDLASVVHAYPTWNDGVWNAAIDDVRGQLERPRTDAALRVLARGRRRWLHRRGR